ncbi:MAG: galactokinase family protein [Verrucomicrobiota bacterium]|jgi:N-acetylgalactosamine kinase
MRPFATIILAGGKGSRMGSSDRHKVCFEVAGVPVIIRALETYNLCGARLNVVVVGMMAESVMATVGLRFPGTAFAFQAQPLGTGDAARKGAEILERMRFDGDVVVAAGDKVIDPRVVRQLLAAHARSGAEVTLATARRPADSTAGIVLETAQGNIVGILEEPERQRLAALAQINGAFGPAPVLARARVERILAGQCSQRTARALAEEIWGEQDQGLRSTDHGPRREAGGQRAEAGSRKPEARGQPSGGGAQSGEPGGRRMGRVLKREEFERRFSREERLGRVRVGAETVRAEQVPQRFGQINLSVYLFRAPVLYDALQRLKPFRAGQEEYLTDVFEILAKRRVPARVAGCEIQDARDLMAFNNPQELLAVEEVYRQREGPARFQAASEPGEVLAPARVWESLLANPPASARRQFRQWYGQEAPWEQLRGIVAEFIRRHGGERAVVIVRSPGRINLMGRHIDHQGGVVNVMAVNREIILVAAPRADDVVSLANTDGSQFSEEVFRISDLIANLNWDDWQGVIDGPRLERLLEAARGDWANYVKAAILRLQDQFRDRRLRGLDMLVSGDIPMGAGLSSSSALVVATAEAVRAFNRLPVSAQQLVSLCGEGEWFVGTRGGAADHAAIKLSRRGCVRRVGFFPFQVQASARFFPDHDLVVCNSGLYAGKSAEARNVFNAKVTAYHLGRVWFKRLRPDLAPRIEHLRDLNRERLGLTHAAFAQLLGQLPARLGRREVQAAFGQMAPAERERLERMFQTHEAPAGGYPVRGVVVFGLSEMARARRCLDLLRRNEAGELGRLMALSHDGDRVSRETARQARRPRPKGLAGAQLAEWAARPGPTADIAELSGDYGCSLPALDRIVDLARRQPGVEGAQLAGAGLGGCIMVLVRKSHAGDLLKALAEAGIQAEVFRPIAGACTLRMGA